MKDQTWCKLGDIYITIIYPRLKESISEYFKSSLVWSWMELICLSPSRHIAMAVAFEPKKLPKVSHFSTVSWMMLDASFLAYRFLTCFDVLYRDVGQCWQLVCFFVRLSNVSTKQMKPGASLLDCGPSGRCHGSWVCHACNAWHFSAVRWNDTIPRLFTFWLFKMQKLHMFITNVLSNQVNLQLKHSCNWMSQCLPKHVMSCWECRDLSNWEVSKWDGQIVAALVAAREASSLKIANAGQSYHTFPFRVDHNTQGLPHIHCIEMSLSIYVKWNSIVDGSISFLKTSFGMFWKFFTFALKSASVHLCPCCSTLMPGTVRFFSKRSRNLYVALMSILYGTPWLGNDQEMSASSSRLCYLSTFPNMSHLRNCHRTHHYTSHVSSSK